MSDDLDIPDTAGSDKSTISFGVLKNAQALGDRQALIDSHRKVIRFHLGEDIVTSLQDMTKMVSNIA